MALSGYRGKAFYFELGEWSGYAMEDSIEIYDGEYCPIYQKDNPTRSIEISKMFAEEAVNQLLEKHFKAV